MEQRIVEFVEVLRQNGLKVAVSEAKDAVRALAEIGIEDRSVTRATLKATLCKRTVDVAVFDRAFDLYFQAASKTLSGVDQSLSQQLEAAQLPAEERAQIAAVLERIAGQLHPLTQAAMQGDRGGLAALFRSAALQLDYARIQNALQTGFFSRRLAAAAGSEAMRTDIQTIAGSLEAAGVTPEGIEAVTAQLAAALRKIEDEAREEVRRQVGARLRKPGATVEDKSLHTLTKKEVALAEQAVRALAEKLKARLTRQRNRKRGTLNPRKTLRKNLTAGGVPMVPQFRARRPHRPDVMVLCDVSDSVRNASRLMLLFTWSLQSLFSRVRSFIFVAEIGEVTSHFKGQKVDAALDAALSSGVISLSANSNCGQSLASFAKSHLGSVRRKTTVFIIGDGRNNYNAANAWALEDLKRKAKRVIWLCPEPKSNWGFGDSEMTNYSRAVSKVVIVRNLAELEKVAPRLIPR